MIEKDIKKTEYFYHMMKIVGTPFVKEYFNPIILNDNVANKMEGPIIYAPNHRSTLDPFVLIPCLDESIHWAALKRFFDGDDSIFNNNKNIILRKLTSYLFKSAGAIPVDRNNDNHEMINIANEYLSKGSSIGIFPEGTTNKTPSKIDLFPIKNGTFHFAIDNKVDIVPISIEWIQDNNIKNKVVVNIRNKIDISNKSLEQIKAEWIREVVIGLKENKEYINNQKNNKVYILNKK